MRSEEIPPAIQEAEQLFRSGERDEAIAKLEELAKVAPEDGSVQMHLGIFLAQEGHLDHATSALRRATLLSPQDPAVFYNLGRHLFDLGDQTEAAQLAQVALRFDPEMTEARDLIAKCGPPVIAGEFLTEGGPIPVDAANATRRGNDTKPDHVLDLGPEWLTIGKVLFVVSLLHVVALFIHSPLASKGPFGSLSRDSISMVQVFVAVTTALLCMGWTTIDLIDRRGRFIWLLPVFIGSLCGSLHAFPFALYLFMGRYMEVTQE